MKKVIFLSIVALIASTGFAGAQMAGGPAPAPRQDGERPDWAAMKERFKSEADTNKDGEVSKEERQAFHDKMRAQHFSKKDTNGDGKLSQDELPRMPAEVFTRLDKDGNGGLSVDEMKHGRHGKGHGRRHGKGRFHKGDFAAHMFKRVDENQDGKITKAEMRAAADKRFTKLDGNKDGVVTLEEAKAHKPHGKKLGKRDSAEGKGRTAHKAGRGNQQSATAKKTTTSL